MRTAATQRLARKWIGPVMLGALALGLASPASATHDDDDDDAPDGCDTVKGKFDAMSVPVPPCTSPVGVCTHGTLKGGLKGSYDLTLDTLAPTPDPDTPTVFFFSGTSVVTLKNGDVITGVDTGALNLAPPAIIGSGSFSTLLTITDGGAGWLHIRGVLDLATGQVAGNYNGVICNDDS
jgi:hypothetical protein